MVLPTQGNSSQVAKSNLAIWRVAKWYSQLKLQYVFMLLCRCLCRWWGLVIMMLQYVLMLLCRCLCHWWGLVSMMLQYVLMLLCRCLCHWWGLVSMMLCFDVVVQMLVSLVRIGQYDAIFWCCCVDACVAGDDWSVWCYFLMLCRCLCRWWWLVSMMLCFDVVV